MFVRRSFRSNTRAAERNTEKRHLSMDATLSYAIIAVKTPRFLRAAALKMA